MIKNNIDLVKHANMALCEGWKYVYGTYGQMLTQKLFEQKLKQYPSQVGQYSDFIEKNYIGNHVADCIGLFKSYLWWTPTGPVYDSKTDINADGAYNLSKVKGPINTIPERIGLGVHKPGHIGIYIGNGWVIESKGTKYGVVKTPLKGSGATAWTHWLEYPFITYVKEESNVGKAFKDVDDGRWSAKHIEAAKELGLISGNQDGTFNPAGPLTREQAAVLMVNLYEKVTGKKVL